MSDTDQKQVEEQIRYQTALLENVSEAVISTDQQMIIRSWNKAAEKIYGYRAEEVVGKPMRDILPPEFAEGTENITMEQLFKNDHWQGEVLQKRKDGRMISIFASATVIRDNEMNALGTVAICRDITNEKQVEDALKESEEKYRTLFENANVGIAITDLTGAFLEVNQAASDITGYSFPELLTMRSIDVYADPADREKIKALVEKDHQVNNYAVLFRTKNGVKFWVSVNARIIRYKGQPLFLSSVIDIDEKKRASDAVKQSLENALELSRVKTNLITFASHELKTPLVPIVGWADFILRALEKGKKIETLIGREEITSIFNSGRRLEQIVDGYLDMGRLEGKNLVLQKKPERLKILMENAIKNVEMLARASKISIYCEVEDTILPVDGFRMEQVFVNILTNAIKYSSPGSDIHISSVRDEQYLKINFVDQGYGFTPEDLKEVWRPFASLGKRNREGLLSGTGIGLYLSKGLIEMHGGIIEIFSSGPDQGCRVEISLPLNA